MAIWTGEGGNAGSNSPFGSSGGCAMKRGRSPSVWSCGMNEERVTQIDGAGRAGRHFDLAIAVDA